MIRCKICGIEQPETEFYLFKNGDTEARPRKRCKTCIRKREGNRYWIKKGVNIPNIQIAAAPSEIEPIEVPPNHKRCTLCKEVKPLTEYYSHANGKTYLSRCKPCNNSSKKLGVWENLDYRQKPGQWISEEQRDIVHAILKKIGWSYNRQKDIWYKMSYLKDQIHKDKDGVWHNLGVGRVRVKPEGSGRKKLKLPMNEIIPLYRMGWSYQQIADQFKCNKTTISSHIHEYFKNNTNA